MGESRYTIQDICVVIVLGDRRVDRMATHHHLRKRRRVDVVVIRDNLVTIRRNVKENAAACKKVPPKQHFYRHVRQVQKPFNMVKTRDETGTRCTM